MYPNLEAEMARIGLKRKDLAPLFSNRIPSVTDKLKGKYSMSLEEAFNIQQTYFPNLPIEYLFAKEVRQPCNI